MQVATVQAAIPPHLRSYVRTPGCIPPPHHIRRSTGIEALDRITGGIPKAAITELTGPPSSGKSSCLTQILTEVTTNGDHCAYVDLTDSFDPILGHQTGISLPQLLWVRCGGDISIAIRATDILLRGGGFAAVVIDLGDLSSTGLYSMPASIWFRYRQALSNTTTSFIALTNTPLLKSTATLCISFDQQTVGWAGQECSPCILETFTTQAHLRRPAQQEGASLQFQAAQSA